MKEEEDSMAAIRKEGGEILELTPEEHKAFVAAVTARRQYGRVLLSLVKL